MSYQVKTPMKDKSKNLFEYPSNISNQKNKLSEVTAQGAIGSLFTRSNSKANPKYTSDISSLKVDQALHTITNEGSYPMVDLAMRRKSQVGLTKPNQLPQLEQSTLPKSMHKRDSMPITKDNLNEIRVRTI